MSNTTQLQESPFRQLISTTSEEVLPQVGGDLAPTSCQHVVSVTPARQIRRGAASYQ